jgi:hypothetical protein
LLAWVVKKLGHLSMVWRGLTILRPEAYLERET